MTIAIAAYQWHMNRITCRLFGFKQVKKNYLVRFRKHCVTVSSVILATS